MAFSSGRFRELLKKYGKVGLGVHFSVSAASITGLYVAVKNNVDVESIFEKIGMQGVSSAVKGDEQLPPKTDSVIPDGFVLEETPSPDIETVMVEEKKKKKNRTAELAASSGGALALAVLLNKALFPVRVPITIALTPPIARFLARRQIIKNSV